MTEETKQDDGKVAETAAETKPAAKPRVNKTTEASAVEPISLKGLDRPSVDGKVRVNPPTAEELEEAETQAKARVKGAKKVLVKTTRQGGRIHYFEAGRYITDEPSYVPDSSWLQMQITAKKVQIAVPEDL